MYRFRVSLPTLIFLITYRPRGNPILGKVAGLSIIVVN